LLNNRKFYESVETLVNARGGVFNGCKQNYGLKGKKKQKCIKMVNQTEEYK